ncbi:hypothetical protein VTN00DRAFT_3887 [Thermoascus crustaceus]|uniref:uncharacterized protein n=1 Tax=Thermoascus crustaceus TaxID=5088 RepID=UPI003743749D
MKQDNALHQTPGQNEERKFFEYIQYMARDSQETETANNSTTNPWIFSQPTQPTSHFTCGTEAMSIACHPSPTESPKKDITKHSKFEAKRPNIRPRYNPDKKDKKAPVNADIYRFRRLDPRKTHKPIRP